MKELFPKYGDVISFDFTFKLVKNTHISGQKWKIGLFLGTSSCKRMVPLGIVMSLYQTKESYLKIFRTYFDAVER